MRESVVPSTLTCVECRPESVGTMFGDNRMRAIHLRQGLTFVNGFPYAGDA